MCCGSRTIEEDIDAILVSERLQADSHLLKLLVRRVCRVPAHQPRNSSQTVGLHFIYSIAGGLR